MSLRLRDLALERRGRGAGLIEQRERRRGAADRVPRLVHRIEKRRERQQPERLERPALDGQRVEDLRQIRGGTQRKKAVLADKYRRFRRGGEQLRDLLGIGGRSQARQPLVAHRRQRKAADGLDDAIELEGPEDSWVHIGNQKFYRLSGCGQRA